MPTDPQMRASDDDRDRAAALLREHHAAGRLTVEEFQERLDAAYRAKTLGEIDKLMADLPAIDLYHLPDESMRRMARAPSQPPVTPEGGHGRLSPAWRAAWSSWACVSLVLFVIWLISAIGNHSANGLWFLWVAGPWGALLLGRWIFGGHPHGPSRPRPGDHHSQLHAEHMQRHAERMQRHAEHIERHRERIERRQDRMRPPGQDDGHGLPGQPPGPGEL